MTHTDIILGLIVAPMVVIGVAPSGTLADCYWCNGTVVNSVNVPVLALKKVKP